MKTNIARVAKRGYGGMNRIKTSYNGPAISLHKAALIGTLRLTSTPDLIESLRIQIASEPHRAVAAHDAAVGVQKLPDKANAAGATANRAWLLFFIPVWIQREAWTNAKAETLVSSELLG